MITESRYRLETPEQIEMDFDLAGPGSRACAMIIDVLMMLLVALVLILCLMLAGFAISPIIEGEPERVLGQWAIAIVIALFFVLTFGYFIICEMLMGGQTPGKRKMQLRTLREDGTPITFTDSLIRNLLRLVDFLPVGYLVGIVVSMIHPMHMRIGDLAARTIVVKEGELDYRANTDKNTPIDQPDITIVNAELAPAERQVISSFLTRRWELKPDARHVLAERIARPLYEKYGGVYDEAEFYLNRLAAGTHHAR